MLALEILTGLLTPLIAIVVVYIAYMQWGINKRKLKLDTFDKRFRVYEELRKLLSIINGNAKVSAQELLMFRATVPEAHFLFGPDISEYLDDIHRHGAALMKWNTLYDGAIGPSSTGDAHLEPAEGMHSEMTWFSGQFEIAKNKFRRYLDLSEC